ncbi:aldo/keto reductase [Paracoccus liaowanqingii]|uniref:Aldo/keto reductase n=1 Tax=Paracoccus liaowanqingii TaxID=2560053 RepID=A0A4Z1CQ99_9RHOB|nr:aldo/keto reductase [Paracoccus liaowanqingii]TGN67199.1 aldo/keto reductase [Paracoccus liaowanqingii]
MLPSDKRRFGRSGLTVTAMGYGTASVGNLFREIDEATAATMFDTAWDAGIRYFDSAPLYGNGLAEIRTGQALRWKNRDDFVLSSKVGRILTPSPRASIDFSPYVNAAPFQAHFDYSYDATLRSIEDSLQRMALERLEICFIHDVDRYTRGDDQPAVFEEAMAGSARALLRLRDEGVIGAVGLGVNEWEVCYAALERHDFDAFLLAGRYTLLEQEALDKFLPLCRERGAGVVLGGGFNSGILATGAIPGAKYNYGPAPDHVMQRVEQIEEICREHDVPLPAAALQFVMAHPVIASFVAGTRTVAQLQQNIDWFSQAIREEFWAALKSRGLLREDAPVPSA